MSLSRKTPMKRGGELKRSRGKSRPIREDRSAAIEKRDSEGRCRVCGHEGSPEYPLEAAHTVGKTHQDVRVSAKLRRVLADAVICLCRRCHLLYDGRKLSILGCLTMPELRNAVAACKRAGLDARRRLGGGRYE